MRPPKCRLCGHEHWNNESHVFKDAINKSHPAINGVNNAINRNDRPERLEMAVAARAEPAICAPDGGGAVPADERTGNRRSRKAYNEYMREYMRRKRSGFIGIAYG